MDPLTLPGNKFEKKLRDNSSHLFYPGRYEVKSSFIDTASFGEV